ncbi:uncharacterized protein LOC117416284 isoform X3 [Acipenser ruthenus]|uniref:uncharacterized protein LOC117416284 isoform X3 n=1 Tax=Acipenser ruthenus TaxID=7906 RepID=UPI002741255D|nr:uncharacterized protein LOC117416284 isoform X3 [Acipenser ruthenus]
MEKSAVEEWTVENVVEWISGLGLGNFTAKFTGEEIDGETLLGLTEHMIGKIFRTMKDQVKFLKALENLKRYPDHIMYSTVLSTLCCKYRFLRDDSQTGYATLLEILRNKFKKERKTLISVETVEDMKKKFGAVGRGRKRAPEQQQPLMEKRRESMQSEEFPGEDEHSTVHTRERMMEKKSTEEVLGLFPFLKHPKLLLHEVELRFGVNLERNLMSGLSRMVDPIFRLSSGHLLTTVMSYIEDASDKTQENGNV